MSSLNSILSHLAEHYIESFPLEAARMLEKQNLSEIKIFVNRLKPSKIVILLEHINPHLGQECLQNIPQEKAVKVLTDISPENGASILRLTSKSKRERFLSEVPKKTSRTLHALVHYPAGTAGALMDPSVLEVFQESTAGQVKKLIKNLAQRDFNYIYVVDSKGYLQGRASFLDFLVAEPKLSMKSIQVVRFPTILAQASSQEILVHPGWLESSEIAVIDEDKRLLGILHYKTLQSLQKKSGRELVTSLATLMRLGETSWVGMMTAYQQLWGIFREQFAEKKP